MTERLKIKAILLAALLFYYLCPVFALANGQKNNACDFPADYSASRTKEYKLPNGLKVLLLEDHSYPVISCFLWYKVGARNETPGKTGLSHLVEHMLFQAVGQYRNNELAATIARAGGQFNGFTADDFTAFYETIHPSKLDLVLKIEAERMRSATFTTEALKEEKSRIMRELDETTKSPGLMLGRQVRSQAYVQHPYHNPTIGWKDDVESLTVEDAKIFYNRFFHPNNATLVLVGDFKTTAVLAQVRRCFGALARASMISTASPCASEPKDGGERRVMMHYSGKKDELEMAYHAPAFSNADVPAMIVLEKLLNAGNSGRLKLKLIDSKICTSAHCAFELKRDPSLFMVNLAGASGIGAQKMLESWDNLLSQLSSQVVTETELKRAKNLSIFAFLDEQDGPYRTAFQLGYFDCMQSWQAMQGWTEKLRAVSALDLLRVTKKYLVATNRVVGTLSSMPRSNDSTNGAAAVKATATASSFGHLQLAAGQKGEADIAVFSSVHAVNNDAPGGTLKDSDNYSAAAKTKANEDGQGKPFGSEQKATDAAQNAGGDAPGAAALVYKSILSNGLTVFVFPSHLAPIVQISGAIKAGSGFEQPAKHGLSALCAQMLGNGPTRLSHQQMVQQQEELGLPPAAMLQFDSNQETINFQTRCLAADLPAQLNLIGSCLKDPSVQENDLDKAKSDLFLNIKRNEASCMNRVNRSAIRALLSSDSAYCPLDAGELVQEIDQLNIADLQDFLGQQVVPGSAVIVIAGDVEPQQALTLAENAFGDWTTKLMSSPRALPAVSPNSRKMVRVFIPGSTGNNKVKTTVNIACLVDTPAKEQDYCRLLVSDCALINHPIFARLSQKIANQADPGDDETLVAMEQMQTEMKSHFLPLADKTVWSLTFAIDPRHLKAALATVEEELKKFSDVGLSGAELSEVKRYLSAALPVRLMSSTTNSAKTILDACLRQDASTLKATANYQAELIDQIKSTDLQSLNNFIKDDFKPDQSIVVIAGSAQSTKQSSALSLEKRHNH